MFKKNPRIIKEELDAQKEREKNKHNGIKKGLIIAVSLFIFALLGLFAINKHIEKVETNRSSVVIKKENSVAFFYKEDCPYCKQILPKIILEKDMGNNIQFINMSSQSNKERFKAEYDVQHVPTFILLNDKGQEVSRYVGNDMNKIERLLKYAKDKN